VKNPLCILLFLCNAVWACNGKNPKSAHWGDRRPIQARLTGAEWRPYSAPAKLQTSCEEGVNDRDKALALLAAAEGDCLDAAVDAVARHAKEDLAAAYLTRFEREGDPVDLLKALDTARGFNRALTLEWLYLNQEAMTAWAAVVKEDSGWSRDAREHLARLAKLPDPLKGSRPDEIATALKRRDEAALSRIAREFPADMARYFEKSGLDDRETAHLLAKALAAAGQHYPRAVIEAMERPKDRAALEDGLAAFRASRYARAAALLERAGNPLYLAAHYYDSARHFSLAPLDATLPHLKPEYGELTARIHMFRGNVLEAHDRFLEAHASYERGLVAARGDPTSVAGIVSRRATNFAFLGAADAALRDAYRVMGLLDRVADANTRHNTYAAASLAARQLGHPRLAFYYRNAAVRDNERSLLNASSGKEIGDAKLELAVALGHRAEILIELGDDAAAQKDLERAAALAEDAESATNRDLLRMRVQDVRGQALLAKNPAGAVAAFDQAIGLAKGHDSTYRAILHFQRATARRNAGDARAGEDMATALEILRGEARRVLATRSRGEFEPLWDPYFSRFQARHHELIESRLNAGGLEEAFVEAERVRAFEPLHLLLQSDSVPPGFRPIETVADIRRAQAALDDDTVILQYLVLPARTYVWILTRNGLEVVAQSVTRATIERWVANALEAMAAGQRARFEDAMVAPYAELFRDPLRRAGPTKTRIVIVPDGPMHGFPFNGLVVSKKEGFLIERASIATAASTSLYLYALGRDRQLAGDRHPAVLLVGDPAFRSEAFEDLPHARQEVEELARDHYGGAAVLMDADATVRRFLDEARKATIIHFAGHAVAAPRTPWLSRLLLAPRGSEPGELSAERLMRELGQLTRTRLVVLGACSTAGGAPVGPQGLAPLVRPLVAANVPAVVGALWDVKDATAKPLLVSLHCHYRHGDDVAVALRNAQLEMLRNNEPAMTWAAFQAVGYAASPYAPPIALEEPDSEHVCTQNSLLGPDGLRPQ
jgi:CHAT domain-containing protein